MGTQVQHPQTPVDSASSPTEKSTKEAPKEHSDDPLPTDSYSYRVMCAHISELTPDERAQRTEILKQKAKQLDYWHEHPDELLKSIQEKNPKFRVLPTAPYPFEGCIHTDDDGDDGDDGDEQQQQRQQQDKVQ